MKQEFVNHTLKNPYMRVYESDHRDEDLRVAWHFHEDIEILFVKKGTKDVYINNTLYTLNAGDVIFINEYTPHKTYTPKGNQTLLLQFNAKDVLPTAYSKQSLPPFLIFSPSDEIYKQLTCELGTVAEENEVQKPFSEMVIQSSVFKILALLYRAESVASPTDNLNADMEKKILPVLDYVKHHYSENIRLEDVGALLALNKSYFCRFFKRCTGMPFVDYLYKIRLSAAESLLLTSEKNITEIAYEVGFSSPAYFTKIFKAHKGYTPSFYKNLQKR